jgi:transcriptional regulator with XRE-family HTH domain
MATQLDIARRCLIDVSTVNKILHRKKGPKFKEETVKAVFKAARVLGYDLGSLKHDHRRRHERKSTAIAVELLIYLKEGQLYDSGTAILRNVSLSGALLGALVLPQKSIPVQLKAIGIRALEGPLKDVEILGRPVRLVHAKEGVEIAIEFMKTEDAQLKQLRKIV